MTLKRTSLLLEQASGKLNSGCGALVGCVGALVSCLGALVVVISKPCAAVVTAAVTVISGAFVEVSNTGGAVDVSAATLGVVSIAVTAGTVVNPKMGGMVAPLVDGADVVAGSVKGASGAPVEISKSGGAVDVCAATLGVVSIAVTAGIVVDPKVGSDVDS
jgi:hypothetical protein